MFPRNGETPVVNILKRLLKPHASFCWPSAKITERSVIGHVQVFSEECLNQNKVKTMWPDKCY